MPTIHPARAAVAAAAAASLLALTACGAQPTTEADPTADSPTVSRSQSSTETDTPVQEATTATEPTSPALASDEPTRATRTEDRPTEQTSAPTATTTSPPPTSSTTSAPADDTGVLGPGSGGPRVQAAQQRLGALGYYVPTVNGTYGVHTKQAVYALQKTAGLPRTGRIDTATAAALQRGVRPQARSGAGLEIDLTRQLVLVVRGGSVVKAFNASSGNGEKFTAPVIDPKTEKPTGKTEEYVAVTPRGRFRIGFQRDELWESKLELGTLYRPKYFNGGIAVHGAGVVPPVPASHGCVRVTNSAMDWLWSSGYAPIGAPVTVY